MKIALITPYANYPGGVESVNQILCNIFTSSGHTIDLVTADDYHANWLDRIMIKAFGLSYITAKKFKSISKNYDLVIANGEFAWDITHPHVINLFHGCYIGYRNYLRKLWSYKQYLNFTKLAWIQRWGAKGKYVITVSEFVKNILQHDGVTVNQVISNCVDTELFQPHFQEKNDKYLFIGSYNYYAKGFDVLEELADTGLSIDCVTNQQPASKLGWIKNINNSQMPDIYNQYKMLIFPSRFEGMPMVPLEAMACGLPIVMSNVGLGPELKKILPQFVVDSYDSDEYLMKIKHIEDNHAEYSQKAREYVEQFYSYDNYKKQWLEVIERIANA